MAVIYSQELLDRATAYLVRSVSERRYDEGLAEISQLLSDITGEPNGGCRQCRYSDYFARVRAYISQATRFLHPETVSTSQHHLKPEFANETFVHEAYGRPVVGGEMTVEDAAFFRKHYPHAFSDSAQPGAGEKSGEHGGGSSGKTPTADAATTQVVTDKPVVPQADLEAEQQAHADTKQKGSDALKAEQKAHTATKADLKKAQAQVKELQTQLEKLTKQVEKAADKITEATEPAETDAK